MKRKKTIWGKVILSWVIVIAFLLFISFIIPRSFSQTAELVVQNTIMLIATYLLSRYVFKLKPKFFSGRKFLSQVVVAIPVLLYLAVMLFGTYINLSKVHSNVGSSIVSSAILGLFAALFEEYYFRVVLQTAIFRATKGSQAIYLSVFVSSLLFSLSHLIVNYTPSNASGVLLQTVATFGFGMYMGALFLRTRNVFWPLLLHAVNDFTSVISSGSIHPSNVQSIGTLINQLFTTLIFILIALFILRKSKHQEIISQFDGNSEWK